MEGRRALAGDLREPGLRPEALPHRACPECGQYGARAERRQSSERPDAPAPTGPSDEPSDDDLREALGDPVLDAELLEPALTHRSYAYENGGLPTNERLEFLGDSVLGVVVTDTLFRRHPDLPEGQLAKLRAAVVNARALAEVARTLGLGRRTSGSAVARRPPAAATSPRSSPTPSRR